MNTDAFYEIGHSHISCEDYALAGNINPSLSFAIVSDGCSSSPDVDVGSRVIAHCAKRVMTNTYSSDDVSPNDLNLITGLSNQIISEANDVMAKMCLPHCSLDATLLMSLSNGKETRVCAYGDGCIIVKYLDGRVEYYLMEYDGGAPYYLSYNLDNTRREAYFREFRQKIIIHSGRIEDGNAFDMPFSPEHDVCISTHEKTSWLFNDTELVLLMSDGVVSYEKMMGERRLSGIPVGNVLSQIAGFKNVAGKFIERRMRRYRKDCQKESVGHYDDISVAGICMR